MKPNSVLLIATFWSMTSALHAAPLVVEAGKTHVLVSDVVLDNDDILEFRGTPDKPCVLAGNRNRITSGPKWTGSIILAHTTIKDLGGLPKRNADGLVTGPGPAAINLKLAGNANFVVEYCTFDACSGINLQTDGDSSVRFRNNTVLETGVVAISKDVANSGDFFAASGTSKAPKRFQGNFIPRGKVVLRGPNWLVGGDKDADANLFIGHRIGIVADGEGTVVRGNYFHLLMPINKEYPYWSQISVFTTGKPVVAERNVIRDGEWIVRFVEGEFRHNIISDIVDHDLMQNGSNGRIHHNLFLAGTSEHRQGSMSASIAIVYPPKTPGEGMEIFNNIFDGGGRLNVPAIEVCPGGWIKSVRNNVFFNFAHTEKYFKRPQAMIRMIWNDDPPEEKPARLGYADFNAFFNPLVKAPRNYLLSVAGKQERKDAGFGKHDLPVNGMIDAQADPKFAGPIPKAFPFSDDDIRARSVGVSTMLDFYRKAYTPAADSPLLGAGDPADGPGTNIGVFGRP